MRLPSGPGHGGASRPGSSRPQLHAVHHAAGGVESLISTASYPKAGRPVHLRHNGSGLQTMRAGLACWCLGVVPDERDEPGWACRRREAQYFGRNKVQYRTFDFQILKTPTLRPLLLPGRGRGRASWRRAWPSAGTRGCRGSSVTTCGGGRSVILYASAAQFRQTNAIEGLIGEGTGGVTEALKRRIVLPMAGSLAETDHVLGHELVHAFQFDMTGVDPREASRRPPGDPGVPAVVRRRDGRVPLARRRRRADLDVDARRGDPREAAAHPRPRQGHQYFPVSLGARVLGVHRREVRRPDGRVAAAIRRRIRASTSPAWRSSWAPTPIR